MLAFIRKAAPYAYCDACLALRVDAALSEAVDAVTELVADGECGRHRRVCYGCRRTLEIAALKDGRPRA